MKPDNWIKTGLGAAIAFGLALMLWPLYALLHRNERVRLERWEP